MKRLEKTVLQFKRKKYYDFGKKPIKHFFNGPFIGIL